jgi:hypothetical protein
VFPEEFAGLSVDQKDALLVGRDRLLARRKLDAVQRGFARLLAVAPGCADELEDVARRRVALEDVLAGDPVRDADDAGRVGVLGVVV